MHVELEYIIIFFTCMNRTNLLLNRNKTFVNSFVESTNFVLKLYLFYKAIEK